MKKYRHLHEVLLLTRTRFAARYYKSYDAGDPGKLIPSNESLKDACWNGLVKEMIPEIFEAMPENPRIFLWQVREANEFFALEMSDYPGDSNKFMSIDPYRFLDVQTLN